jgi:signal transduction histidine kinase
MLGISKLKVYIILILLILSVGLSAKELSNYTKILVLFSQSHGTIINKEIYNSLQDNFEGMHISFSAEYIDGCASDSKFYKKHFSALIYEKYFNSVNKRIDCIIAIQQEAINYSKSLIANESIDVPVFAVDFDCCGSLDKMVVDNMVRCSVKVPIMEQLSFIKTIQPDINKLYVINENSEHGSWYKKKFMESVKEITFLPKSKIVNLDLKFLEYHDLNYYFKKTNNRDAFLILNSSIDKYNNRLFYNEVIEYISDNSSAAIYTIFENSAKDKLIGGYTIDYNKLGEVLTKKIVLYLNGMKINNIKMSLLNLNKVEVYSEADKRFHVDISRFKGDIIYVDELTWSKVLIENRHTVVITLIILLIILVFALFYFLVKSKKYKQKAKYYGEHYEILFDKSQSYLLLVDRDSHNIITFSERMFIDNLIAKNRVDDKEALHVDDLFGEDIYKIFDAECEQFTSKMIEVEFDYFETRFKTLVMLLPFLYENKRYYYVIFNKFKKFHDLREHYERELKIAINKERTLSAIFNNITREIRNPLNIISGFSELIYTDTLDKVTKNAYADIIANNSQTLIKVMNKVLAYSVIESNQVQANKKEFRINNELRQIVKKMEKSIIDSKPALKLDLYLSLPDDADVVINDKKLFNTVFNELLENAINFTEIGGIECGYTSPNNNEIIFYVKDSGCGIPEENLQYIFEKYKHPQSLVEKSGNEGVGLGLAICKNYISSMGGSIWLNSTEGKGTTFFFYLEYDNREKPDSIEFNKYDY